MEVCGILIKLIQIYTSFFRLSPIYTSSPANPCKIRLRHLLYWANRYPFYLVVFGFICLNIRIYKTFYFLIFLNYSHFFTFIASHMCLVIKQDAKNLSYDKSSLKKEETKHWKIKSVSRIL